MTEWIRKSQERSYFTVFLVLSVLATALIIGRIFKTQSIRYVFLVWNIILAWLPYLISFYMMRLQDNEHLKFWLAFPFWLLFFPNAPYMLTDFIHVPHIEFGPHANVSLLAWLDVIVISLFIWIGYWLGLESLKVVHKQLYKRLGTQMSWICIMIISVLSGYAIFIGRYARLNSWDVFRPLYLLNVFVSQLNVTSLIFSFMFAMLILISYVIYKELSQK